jgi:hypothetical protein
MKDFKPVIIDGEVAPDYFVSPDGNIWSTKGKKPRQLKPGNTKTQNNYPKVVILFNGKGRSQLVHKLVCVAYNKFPKPDGVTIEEWKATPESVKRLVESMYQVNHIDHDHYNHHPSNLEWVTVKQNSKKYQEHRESKQ